MKKILSYLLLAIFCMFSFMQIVPSVDAAAANNIPIWGEAQNESGNLKKNEKLLDFNGESQFIEVSKWGEKWLYNTLIRFARDLKNLFYAVATIFFLVIALKLIFASNTEEELGKFKKGIIWITIGIIIMQLAFAFTKILFDQGVDARLWVSLIEHLFGQWLLYYIHLLLIFFIAMAIYAFYRLVTANGNEEAIKSWKKWLFFTLS